MSDRTRDCEERARLAQHVAKAIKDLASVAAMRGHVVVGLEESLPVEARYRAAREAHQLAVLALDEHVAIHRCDS